MDIVKKNIFSIVTSIVILSIFYIFLNISHPAEDAYILFIYVKNLVAGHGISYFPGAAPSEGATDFLWMILISCLHFIGFYPAIGAGLINAASAGGIFYILSSILKRHLNVHNLSLWQHITILCLVIFSQIFFASIVGFSVYFYSFSFLLLFYVMVYSPPEYLKYIPLIGIMISLIRPDGVMPSVVAVLIMFGYVIKYHTEHIKPYIITSITAFIIGCAYFIWRYHYFGFLFPLPIYVKSSSPEFMPGLDILFKWLFRNDIIPLMLFPSLYMLWQYKNPRLLLGMIPPVILLVSFCFFVPSQNIGYRFQNAPYFIFLAYFICFLFDHHQINKRYLTLSFYLKAVLLTAFIFLNGKYIHKRITRNDIHTSYLKVISYHLRDNTPPESNIILTEAGQFAYWGQGKFYDLVGLNTSETALNGPTADYIETINPDMIFFHSAGMFHFDNNAQKPYFMISPQKYDTLLSQSVPLFEKARLNVEKASIAALTFLSDHNKEYDIILLPQDRHIYAIKKQGRIQMGDFMKALEKSKQKQYQYGYLALEKNTPL